MTVKQLIQTLQTLPQDLPVKVPMEEGDDCDVTYVGYRQRAQTDLRPQDKTYIQIY